jgi:hypothetical protein
LGRQRLLAVCSASFEATTARVASQQDAPDELAGEGVDLLPRCRLGDQVEGALGERVDSACTGRRGECRDDDDRDHQLALAQLAQDTDTVPPRHREVQREHVGRELLTLRESFVAVARDSDDVDSGLGQRFGQHGPHQRRVVGDHNPR